MPKNNSQFGPLRNGNVPTAVFNQEGTEGGVEHAIEVLFYQGSIHLEQTGHTVLITEDALRAFTTGLHRRYREATAARRKAEAKKAPTT